MSLKWDGDPEPTPREVADRANGSAAATAVAIILAILVTLAGAFFDSGYHVWYTSIWRQ